MPWSTSVTGRFSGFWQYLQTASRRGRSTCRTTETCSSVVSDNFDKEVPREPRLLGRKEHMTHSLPARPRVQPSTGARRASRGRSRSPDVDRSCTSRDDNLVSSIEQHVREVREDALAREPNSLFQRFCREQFCRQISMVSGTGLEESQTTSADFMLRLRREVRLAELFPKCFSLTLAGDTTTIGPGVVVIEVERQLKTTKQALRRFGFDTGRGLPAVALLLTSFDKERGTDIVGAQQLYSELVLDFQSLFPRIPFVLACTSFDVTACAEREASLLGRRASSCAVSSDMTEGRGRTVSRGSRSRRDHAPARRVLSREPCNIECPPSGGSITVSI